MTSDEKYSVSYSKAAELEGVDDGLKTVPDCLRYYADTRGEQDAMIFASTERTGTRTTVTWSELYDNATRVAKALIAIGVKRDEVVCLNMRQSPEWLFMAYGAMCVGARVATILHPYKDADDLVAIMDRLQTCALLALDPGPDGRSWDVVQGLLDMPTGTKDGRVKCSKMAYLRYLIGAGFPESEQNIKTVQDLLEENHPTVELPTLNEDDIILIFPTMGSPDLKKSVAHTHKSILISHKLQECQLFTGKKYICYKVLPFHLIAGFPMNVLYGQSRVTISGFDKPMGADQFRFMEIIQEERCSLVVVLPQRLKAMMHASAKLPSDWPVDLMVVYGQPMEKQLSKAVGKICKALNCGYGSTELLLVSEAYVTDPDCFTEYACGKPITGSEFELKIVADDGAILPVNTRGELYVRGPSMFKEYYNNPEMTKDVFTEDGWYMTGDLASMNADGEFFIEGRKANMIRSGQHNVATEMLERAISFCPGVAMVVVVPVPDVTSHNLLCACVIVKKGSDVTEDDLRKHCEGIQDQFPVVPTFYMFLETFPLEVAFNPSRKALQSMAKERFA